MRPAGAHAGAAWTFLTGPLSHVSSTAIRNKAKARRTGQEGAAAGGAPWRKPKAKTALQRRRSG